MHFAIEETAETQIFCRTKNCLQKIFELWSLSCRNFEMKPANKMACNESVFAKAGHLLTSRPVQMQIEKLKMRLAFCRLIINVKLGTEAD